MVKLLPDREAAGDTTTKDGEPALMRASRKGCSDIVKILLEKSADINAKDRRGLSALYWASTAGHHTIVELLKAHGGKE